MIDDQYCLEISKFLKSVKDGALWDWKVSWDISNRFLSTLVRIPPIENHCPPKVEDYEEYIRLTEKRLANFVPLIQEIKNQHSKCPGVEIDSDFTGSVLLLYGLHHSEGHLWTTKVTVKYAEEVLSELMNWMRLSTLPELLSRNNLSLCAALKQLSDVDDWISNAYPAVALEWIVFNVNFQCLVSGEQRIMLAMMLRLLDDFKLSSNQTGLRCLSHTLENVTRADFRPWALVYVDTLMKLLHNPKPSLIGSIVTCLLATIKKSHDVSKSPNFYDIHLPWSQYDDLLVCIQSLMCREEGGNISVECLEVLPSVLQVDTLIALRHSKEILNMVERVLSLSSSNPVHLKMNRLALLVLKKFVSLTNEHSSIYADLVMFILSKKKVDLTLGTGKDPGNLLLQINELVEVIMRLAPDKCSAVIHDLNINAM